MSKQYWKKHFSLNCGSNSFMKVKIFLVKFLETFGEFSVGYNLRHIFFLSVSFLVLRHLLCLAAAPFMFYAITIKCHPGYIYNQKLLLTLLRQAGMRKSSRTLTWCLVSFPMNTKQMRNQGISYLQVKKENICFNTKMKLLLIVKFAEFL